MLCAKHDERLQQQQAGFEAEHQYRLAAMQQAQVRGPPLLLMMQCLALPLRTLLAAANDTRRLPMTPRYRQCSSAETANDALLPPMRCCSQSVAVVNNAVLLPESRQALIVNTLPRNILLPARHYSSPQAARQAFIV
jgi:hypothetical protein